MNKGTITTFITCIAFAVLALAAPAAVAQAPSVTQDQYKDSASQFAAGGGGDPADPSGMADPASTGSLPFTGLDLALMGVAAAGLLGIGVVIRRQAARGETG